MPMPLSRRAFLADVGRGVLVASVGATLAADLGLGSAALAEEAAQPRLLFGGIENLVALMQETPVERLLPVLVQRIKAGEDLGRLTAAAALANARTFGGEDYVGFHTMMALSPAYRMAKELPERERALPVLKVLYRNTSRIREFGGPGKEVLHPVTSASSEVGSSGTIRAAVRGKDVGRAEATLAALASESADAAFNELLLAVQDNTEVHRVVLPYRAWDMLDVVGREHAHTMLRQSVRYCVKAESWPRSATWDEPREVLPKLLEQYRLLQREPGTRVADDEWVAKLSGTFFASTPAQAAEAAASALAEGFSPDAIGEAISLAANQLVLRDVGRGVREESPGKPAGSVHGDSIGVHASDSANAWRNMARVSNARNTFACLILGAYQVALDRGARGGDFQNWEALPLQNHARAVTATEPAALLRDLDEAIRASLQGRASAIVHRYGSLGHDARGAFDVLLRFAVSEDGALHAEKYYRTVSDEFATGRPAFRWRHLVGLARVTASEYGRPAAGYGQARELLGI
jgi:hypothetical protein